MLEYVLDKKISSDVKVILIDSKSKKTPAGLNKYFSEEEIGMCEVAVKNGSDCASIITSKSEIVLFNFDYKADNVSMQKQGAKLGKQISKFKSASIYFGEFKGDLDYLVIGLELSTYRFNKYFTKDLDKKEVKLQKVSFISTKGDFKKQDLSKSLILADSVNYVREFVNEPSNNLTPEIFANNLLELKKNGLDVKVLEEKELKKLGFNLLLSVSKGSDEEPKVVVFSWKGNPNKKDYDLALIGKGVMFDSGGLSLKPSNSMDGMHTDMAGSAAVAGTMKAISELKVNKNILGVVGLVENMPSGKASKVNDIVKSMSGQTVEILNTDAEGRLVLADLITYTQEEYKVNKIIDLATLTGAVSMLFGPLCAGLFCNNKKMIDDLVACGENTDNKLWNLPIDDYFDKSLNSDYADMQNIGKHRVGGGSQGACFLKRFVEKGTSWAHLDIAGVAREFLDSDLYAKGGTGFGVKLLVKYIEELK